MSYFLYGRTHNTFYMKKFVCKVFANNNRVHKGLGSIRFATKKAGGSSKNGRDSKPKFLGLKVSGGSSVQSGSIILRQRGKRYRPIGDGSVGIGRDHTLYAKVDGKVVFKFKNHRQYVGVVQ